MNLYEIDTKYIRFMGNLIEVLESYTSPSDELDIEFNEIHSEDGMHYYNGFVSEKESGDKIVLFNFTIGEHTNSLHVDNIQPVQSKISSSKIMHTTAGSQVGAMDMGYVAVKWLLNKLKEYAISKGYTINRLKSATRFSGARAKNNPDANGASNNFDVDVALKEYYIYECISGNLFRYTV